MSRKDTRELETDALLAHAERLRSAGYGERDPEFIGFFTQLYRTERKWGLVEDGKSLYKGGKRSQPSADLSIDALVDGTGAVVALLDGAVVDRDLAAAVGYLPSFLVPSIESHKDKLILTPQQRETLSRLDEAGFLEVETFWFNAIMPFNGILGGSDSGLYKAAFKITERDERYRAGRLEAMHPEDLALMTYWNCDPWSCVPDVLNGWPSSPLSYPDIADRMFRQGSGPRGGKKPYDRWQVEEMIHRAVAKRMLLVRWFYADLIGLAMPPAQEFFRRYYRMARREVEDGLRQRAFSPHRLPHPGSE